MHTTPDTQFTDNHQLKLAMSVILDLIEENNFLRAALKPVDSKTCPASRVLPLDSKHLR